MKHRTRKYWLTTAAAAAEMKGVTLKGTESRTELRKICDWYLNLWKECDKVYSGYTYGLSRPKEKATYHQGKKYILGFFHNGWLAYVKPADKPLVSRYITNTPSCVFVVSKAKGGGIAATTRPADKGGGIGLPGGKMEGWGWEKWNPAHTGRRESKEEGWNVTGQLHFLVDQVIEGQLVRWMAHTREASPLAEYKEKHRGVEPVVISPEELCSSGWGNDHPKIVKWVRKHCQINEVCVGSALTKTIIIFQKERTILP